MKKILFSITFAIGILFFSINSNAQEPTIGLLYSDGNAFEGYTLFTPSSNQNVYLINNCGEKINEWTFSELPGATCYLLENGTLLRAGKDSLEIRDWDNTLLWSYAAKANGILQHHDIEPLPNGNILCVCRDTYTSDEILAEGRDSALVTGNIRLEKIIELEPVGTNEANIVWEWKFFDHFIQDYDDTKPNFGIVEDHPELLDLNFDNDNNLDWIHLNAIDYNSELDQLIISSKHLCEIYIIDHSTTTEEAAGHTGGNSNLGGDFLWRWGNPQVYQQGSESDQKLFQQHDSKWIEKNYLDEGKITIYNNLGDGSGDFSSIHIITPVINNGIYELENNRFLPMDFEWSWDGLILGNVVSDAIKSGAHALPNGNFIICETSLGQFSEITKNGDHLWTYKNPVGTEIYNQYDEVLINPIFRAEKYPVDYIGFDGRDMTPDGIIEDQNSNTVACLSVDIEDFENTDILKIINPAKNGSINFNRKIEANDISITDISGKQVYKHGYFNGTQLEVVLKPAIYILQVFSNKKIESLKVIVQ